MPRIIPACLVMFGFAGMVAGVDPQTPPAPLKAPPAKMDPPKAEPKKTEKTDPAEAHALAAVLRDLLAKNLPDPLCKSNQNWGHQKAVTVVIRHREGLRFWSEPVQEMRNDGVWRRVAVHIPDPSKVTLAVTELTHPEECKVLATVGVIAERVEVKFEQQVWRNGLRLYAGETRGHCKGSLIIKAEVISKAEFKKGSLFPDVSLRIRATEAQLGYDDLVIDHTAGLDGEAAKAIGDLAIRTIKAIKPDLEHELLEKADAAIVKAAGTKEVKGSLDSLMKQKK